ncbi:hypothetical protein GOODEAATRI_021984 [Goodea atripinnis]|uniref:Uncharacterized protein n=1 Tax=Goodea atripinnis TaxID=208336 RepID=A0ABV0Q014_9TELE
MKPSSENLTTIKQAMTQTFTQRRTRITTQSPTLTEIFQQYPRFIDMPCLFDADFGKLFEGKADNFLCKWETNIIPKLMKIASSEMSEDLSTSSFSGNTNDGMSSYTQRYILNMHL